jgi:hypothetical protein
MTRDDIIRLAQEASSESDYDFPNISALERFAALVAKVERVAALIAAAEREACAEICDEYAQARYEYAQAKFAADAIRARGNK